MVINGIEFGTRDQWDSIRVLLWDAVVDNFMYKWLYTRIGKGGLQYAIDRDDKLMRLAHGRGKAGQWDMWVDFTGPLYCWLIDEGDATIGKIFITDVWKVDVEGGIAVTCQDLPWERELFLYGNS